MAHPIVKQKGITGIWNIWASHLIGEDERYELFVEDSNVLFHPPLLSKEVLAQDKENLLTNDGRDWMHAQVYTNIAAGTIGANYIAVTVNATAPAATDTTLTGEISTGGLARAQATTRTHTTGTNATTLAITFTASAQHTAVQKGGLFNAASAGIMAHENTFTAASLEINDTLTITATLNLG
jgi:hypothetical protein